MSWKCQHCRRCWPIKVVQWPVYCACGAVTYEGGAVRPPGCEGPGTHLHRILQRLGIREAKDCGCGDKVRLMDARGPDWCEANIEQIVDWLIESASKHNTLSRIAQFGVVRAAARALVNRAIAASRAEAGAVSTAQGIAASGSPGTQPDPRAGQ